jgi:redox-sensitive bicupin YhaK (pirin superfamily)
VQHSEFNASTTDPVTLFQIWLFPKQKDIKPRYDQRTFDTEERKDKWQIVVSPREEDKALWINQDARFALTNMSKGKMLSYTNAFAGNGMYLVVISGEAEVSGHILQRRDAMGISETDTFTVTAKENTELLVIEVPMR